MMQGLEILPYTPLYPKQVKAAPDGDGEGIKLLVANVLMDNRNWGRVVQLVSELDPDVVALVETDAGWRAGLSELTASYPYTVSVPQDNTYGILLYSRLPLRSTAVEFLFESDVPSIHTQVVLASGKSFDLHILHPRPPAPSEAEDTTERDAELLLVGKQVAQRGRPAIVAGDLNDVAWSATTKLFQKTSGLLDPRVGRGLFSTFHAEHWLLRWPLDHVFHSEHFHLAELRRLEPIGSDHFPIFVHLVLDPDAPARQEEPKADSAEKQRADEKIAEPTRGGKE